MTDHASNPAPTRFIPVPIDAVDFQVLQMDLYLRFDGGPHTLYRGAGLHFTTEDVDRLRDLRVQFLYIPATQHAAYRKSLSARLTRTFRDPDTAAAERGRVVRASCAKIIEDVLLFPGEREHVQAVEEVSRTFAEWSREDPAAFSYLLDMSEHDFGTATHMINVGVGCGLLAREVAPGDEAFFHTVVQGGMLHDLGKRGIPQELLNKEGKLTDAEWKIVSSHPTKGFEELSKNPDVPEAVLSMVRDHHEHLSGAGYPRGLRGDQVSLPARICAVVDVFDAITAARPYRGATPPAETLRIMGDGRGRQFDPKLFDTFHGMVDRLLEADPSRGAAGDGSRLGTLRDILPDSLTPRGVQAVELATQPRDSTGSYLLHNRRRYERFNCPLPATASFLLQGKPTGIALHERFTLRLVDLGRGGLRVLTPWPLSINDVLSVELQPRGGVPVTRLTRVVRVRKHHGGWAAGLAFIDAESQKKAA